MGVTDVFFWSGYSYFELGFASTKAKKHSYTQAEQIRFAFSPQSDDRLRVGGKAKQSSLLTREKIVKMLGEEYINTGVREGELSYPVYELK